MQVDLATRKCSDTHTTDDRECHTFHAMSVSRKLVRMSPMASWILFIHGVLLATLCNARDTWCSRSTRRRPYAQKNIKNRLTRVDIQQRCSQKRKGEKELTRGICKHGRGTPLIWNYCMALTGATTSAYLSDGMTLHKRLRDPHNIRILLVYRKCQISIIV